MASNRKLGELRLALRSRNAKKLARVFSLPPIQYGGRAPRSHPAVSLEVENGSDGGVLDFGPVVTAFMDAVAAADAGDPVACFDAQAASHAAFNRLFSSSEGNWLVPALIVACRNTHKAAFAADKASSVGAVRKDNARLQKAVPILQDSYSKTSNDRTEFVPNAPFDAQGSKKAGVLSIVNELFAIYFRLNILRLCKNLIRPVETRKLHEQGEMGEKVTYRYYIGRLNMFEDRHDLAEQNLGYAFDHCHRNALHNKKCILRYLIPVKLYRGRLPSMQLLDKYGLDEFKPIVDGVRKGDLRTFQDGLVRYQDRFIRQGTYLLLEKCKTVCYRNLFKRVCFIVDKHQIALAYVARALKWLEVPIDLDEVECILANLIYRGYIRGYLSHSKRVLVLSKRDPFPISSVVQK